MAGDPYWDKFRSRFSETGVGTNAGVTVTHAAVTGRKHVCTSVECSGDAAALVTIESPASTVLWRKRYAAAFTMSETFPLGTLVGSSAGAILVKISASTSNCEANIHGGEIAG